MHKNIFFLFPAGYSGNYLQWIFNVSEVSKTEFTIKDPLLPNGTSHGFTRKPTHTGIYNILNWIIKNQPTSPQTFILYATTNKNLWSEHPAHAAYRLLKSYPDGLIINIHAADADEAKVGALNSYTKWTTWMYDQAAFNPDQQPTFDWEGGKNNKISISDRNWLYNHWQEFFLLNDQPFNWEELKYNIECFRRWYKKREELEPSETNSQQFNSFETFPTDNIFDISLGQLYSTDFFETSRIFQWVESQNAGTFDWTYAKSYHHKYLQAQDNLKWFANIDAMRKHKQVSRWLLQNTLSQAFLLEEVASSLSPGWEGIPTEDILTSLGYKIAN